MPHTHTYTRTHTHTHKHTHACTHIHTHTRTRLHRERERWGGEREKERERELIDCESMDLCSSLFFSLTDTIHFTQLVWKSTTEIGVGVARVRGQDRWVIVTHYRPQGNTNMPGDFKTNVLPPLQTQQDT